MENPREGSSSSTSFAFIARRSDNDVERGNRVFNNECHYPETKDHHQFKRSTARLFSLTSFRFLRPVSVSASLLVCPQFLSYLLEKIASLSLGHSLLTLLSSIFLRSSLPSLGIHPTLSSPLSFLLSFSFSCLFCGLPTGLFFFCSLHFFDFWLIFSFQHELTFPFGFIFLLIFHRLLLDIN